MGMKTTGKKGQEREKSKNDEPGTWEEVINSKNGLSMSPGDDIELLNKHIEKSKNRHEVSDNDVEFRASQSEAVIEGNVGEKKKKKKTPETKVKFVELSAIGNGVVMKDDVDDDEKKRKNKQRNEVADNEAVLESHVGKDKRKKKCQELSGNGTEFNVNQRVSVIDSDVHANKKRQEVSGNNFELRPCQNEAVRVGDEDMNNIENEKDRKKKKKRKLETIENEIWKDKRINKVSEASQQKHLGVEENSSLQRNAQEDSGNNSELEARKKRRKRHEEYKNNDGIDTVAALNDTAENSLMSKVVKVLTNAEEKDNAEIMNLKEGNQEKKKKHRKGEKGGGYGTVINKGTNGEAGRERVQLDGRNTEGHAVLEEDGDKKKEKKKKAKSDKIRLESGDKKMSRTKMGVEPSNPSESSPQTERSKKVSFSDHVQVFTSSDGLTDAKNAEGDGLVRGKRFSQEEDEVLKKAVINYIEAQGLGEEGLNMVMHCRSHPEIKNCWKEIGAALPWRPVESVYYRAHIIFQRDENRKWTPEELELVRKFHEKHGSDWKVLAEQLGKHRFHVKDAWRRVRLPNQNKGQWSQEEYQKLFDLVNMDLHLKALEEKKTKHGMLRDNISWEAISDKLATRSNAICCMKWYNQLTSPMVAEGKWVDTDDFRLVNALSGLDACCMDDVDWDNLLEHRSGTICRKRWNQIVKHLGTDRNKSFPEQVEILSTRYSPDVLEAREAYNSKPAAD